MTGDASADQLLVPLVLGAVLGLLPARIAAAKGRSFARWWFYGWMLFIVALPHALLLPRRDEPERPSGGPEPGHRMIACPSCGEQVRADTPACPFCRGPVAG